MKKILKELQSVKVWGMIIATLLLVKHYLTGTNWVATLSALASLREASNAHYRMLKGVEDEA